MSNSFGRLFRVMTWGESHGPSLGALVDGCPAGLSLTPDDFACQLARDVPDKEIGTPRGEENQFQILSGVFLDRTLGTPIAVVIWNNDARPQTYEVGRDTLRPGHADFTWLARFGHTDYRGGSRASGRECIGRLAAGAIARKLIALAGVWCEARVTEMAGLPVSDDASYARAREKVLELGVQGESTGGIVDLVIRGVPAGVGSPVFGKLQADLGHAFLTIGGVKGVEYGLGFQAARMTGSAQNDGFAFDSQGKVRTLSNNCGGLLGGISTGGEIPFRLAVKPTPTIPKPQPTVNVSSHQPLVMEYQGRFDKNFVPRIVPIAEAMAACVVADHLLLSGILPPAKLDRETA